MTRQLQKRKVGKINYQYIICIVFMFATLFSGISTVEAAGGLTSLLFPDSQYKTHEAAFIPDKGLHGVWVTTVGNTDFPSKQGLSADAQKKEADAILDKVLDMGLNTVFFQVRPDSDALYKSKIYPWSDVLTGTQGKDPGYDPLQYFLDGAHKRGLKLQAWINPYRVQTKNDKTKLCSTQPAVVHPEWAVATKDDQLYYDPGIPEVRAMVENGIIEIVKNYNVDGIVFDDYFYPEKDFSDAATFKKNCSTGQTVEDFRRNCVNQLVRETYTKIKAENPKCKFGISPAGVWANSDQTLLGSNTKGAFSSYYEQYADTRLWVKNNWVDYICPQIYWAIGNDKADYTAVLDWWVNTVKGTNVDLYISHGAYNQGTNQKGWTSPDQTMRQVREASKYKEYKGSVFYDYTDLVKNKDGFATAIKNYYNGKLIASSFGKSLVITSPANNSTTSESRVRITGSSDYNYPLMMNGTAVERGEDGYFSTYVNLTPGKNEFTFVHKGETQKFVINSSVEVITSVSPNKDITADGGSQINISAVAHVDAIVYAQIGTQKIKMAPADSSGFDTDKGGNSLQSDYCTYQGVFTLPETSPEVQDLGKISVSATYANSTKTLTGAHIKVNALSIKTGDKVVATVVPTTVNKSFVETFLYADNLYRPVACPQVPGSWDYVETTSDGKPKKYFYASNTYYRLSCGLMLYSGNVKISAVKSVPANEIKGVSQDSVDSGRYTRFIFDTTSKVTYNAGTNIGYTNASYNSSGKRNYSIDSFNAQQFSIYLFNTTKVTDFKLKDNPLFSGVKAEKVNNTTVKYTFTLKKRGDFYGFEVTYNSSGDLVLDCKNPWDGNVKNLKVSIDPGHGGIDYGATAGNAKEKDLNLNISLKVKNILIDKYGLKESNICMIRTKDELIAPTKGDDLQKRILNIAKSKSDVSLCIHQNDGGGEGYETYYFQPFSRDLASSVQSALTDAYKESGFKAANRGCKFCSDTSYYSCRQTQYPSILVECGFIDSSKDRNFLTSTKGSDAIANALAKSVLDYAKTQK